MVVYIVVTVIPLFLLGSLSFGMLRGQLKKSYEMQLEAECIRVKGTLFDITSSVYSFSEPIVSVQSYRDIFSKEEFGSDEKQVYKFVDKFHDIHPAKYGSSLIYEYLHQQSQYSFEYLHPPEGRFF